MPRKRPGLTRSSTSCTTRSDAARASGRYGSGPADVPPAAALRAFAQGARRCLANALGSPARVPVVLRDLMLPRPPLFTGEGRGGVERYPIASQPLHPLPTSPCKQGEESNASTAYRGGSGWGRVASDTSHTASLPPSDVARVSEAHPGPNPGCGLRPYPGYNGLRGNDEPGRCRTRSLARSVAPHPLNPAANPPSAAPCGRSSAR